MMQCTYNGVALHELGRLVITRQGGESEPPEAPRRWIHHLGLRVETTEDGYAANRALLEQAVAALRTPHARLTWRDDAGRTYLDQEVTVASHTFPDEVNAWGAYRQALEIQFAYEDHALEARALEATFQRTGSGVVLDLGRVHGVAEGLRVARYDGLKDPRQQVGHTLSLRGQWDADTAAPLETRRASLLAQLDLVRSEIRQAITGTLRYANYDQLVRVEAFHAEVDQAVQSLPWSLEVEWTSFPQADGYAQAEFRVSTSVDPAKGETVRTLAGRIGSDSEALAQAKLASLRAALAPPAEWEPLSLEAEAQQVSDEMAGLEGDGEAFLALSFNDRYRQVSGDILEYELRVEDQDDPRSGLWRTTYSGFVVARGNTADAAWTAAVAKARTLGNHKLNFRVSARETRTETPPVAGRQQVRCEYAYEYTRKGAQTWIELQGQVVRDPFGVDVERVTGRVSATDWAAAETAYAGIKSGYTGLLRAESRQKTEERMGLLVKGPPSAPFPQDTSVPGYARQELGYEFQFEVVRAKAVGDLALRYEIEVESDYLARERTTTVQGSAWGPSEAATLAYVEAFLATLTGGQRVRSRRTTGAERGFDLAGAERSAFVGLQFADTYSTPIEGPDQILECSLTEEIQCSGPRRVVAPTASSTDVIQTCGTMSGRRVVSGTVTALTEPTALAWARRQRHLPYLSPAPVERYAGPPECRIEHTMVALQDGVARTGTYGALGAFTRAHVKAVRVSFSFTEYLPVYDPLA